MRIETLNDGTKILCEVILPKGKIKVGSKWVAGGSVVEILNVDEHSDWVEYHQKGSPDKIVAKDRFSFQCRYCLVLEDGKIPDYLKDLKIFKEMS